MTKPRTALLCALVLFFAGFVRAAGSTPARGRSAFGSSRDVARQEPDRRPQPAVNRPAQNAEGAGKAPLSPKTALSQLNAVTDQLNRDTNTFSGMEPNGAGRASLQTGRVMNGIMSSVVAGISALQVSVEELSIYSLISAEVDRARVATFLTRLFKGRQQILESQTALLDSRLKSGRASLPGAAVKLGTRIRDNLARAARILGRIDWPKH